MKKWLLISTALNLSLFLIPSTPKVGIKGKIPETFVTVQLIEKRIIKGARKSSNLPLEEKNELVKTLVESKVKSEIENKSQNKIEEKNTKNLEVEEKMSEIPIQENTEKKETESVEVIEKLKEIKETIEHEVIESVVENNNEVNKKAENTNFLILEKTKEADEKEELFSSNNLEKEEIDENVLSENGVILVKDNSSLSYRILESPNPIYPQKAKILSFKEKIEIVSEFTVDLKGNVKDILLYSKFGKFKKYDFDKAVEGALKKYKFSPIIYKGKNVEVRVRKVFEFN